ncbi:DUF4149 domain-containing protein [Rugamonas sp.]|uniref:DUF4149 domain-containing protein n=1 Tax=Rugamonas sp. TaxID=1926287 RepID=UPI00345C1881
MARARLLVTTAWAGSLWTVGMLVVPTLFRTLSDHVLVGTIAASLFDAQAWVGMACAVAMLALVGWGGDPARVRRTLLLIVLAMLACTVAFHFGLQPMMAQLRAAAGPAGVMESALRARFGLLHGVSMGIYLIQSLLAACLLFKQYAAELR